MVEFLMYTTLLCEDADAIVLRIKKHERMTSEIKLELVDTIMESTPNCPWDAND